MRSSVFVLLGFLVVVVFVIFVIFVLFLFQEAKDTVTLLLLVLVFQAGIGDRSTPGR